MDKFPLKSKTILAGLLGAAVTFLPFFGITIGESDVALLTEAWDKVLGLVSLLGVIYGRYDVSKKIVG